MSPTLDKAAVRGAPYLTIAALGVVGLWLSQLNLTSQGFTLLTFTLIFGIAALGLGFLWGQAGQLNIAHAAVFGAGAYAAAIANEHELPFFVGTALAAAAGCVAAALVSLPSIRSHGHYFIILTFAIGEVAVYLASRWDSVTGGLKGKTVIPATPTVLGIDIYTRSGFFQLCVVFAVVVVTVTSLLMRSRWGTTLRGIRDNPDLARALGTSVILHRILAFGVSGILAGVAGQLYAFQSGYIEPSFFDTHVSITFMLMAVLGGNTYLFGPLIGAAFYQFLPQVLPLSPHRSEALFGIMLIACVLLFPGGLSGALGRGLRAVRARRAASRDDPTPGAAPAEPTLPDPDRYDDMSRR